MDNNIKEVKRPANEGEYIKIVDRDSIETDYENGDIFKVVKRIEDNVYINMLRKDTGENIFVLYEEYVVLEGYNEETKEYDEESKGNDDMNKVLKLYYDRKVCEINDKYEKKVEDDFNNIDIVKKYNELIEKFEKEQEQLFKNIENLDNDYLTLTSDVNRYKYRLNTLPIKDKLEVKYNGDYNKEIDELNELRDEVDAQLSLSDDLGYQIEVLSNYGIIDKKSGNKLKA